MGKPKLQNITWTLKHMAGIALVDADQADATEHSNFALVPLDPLPVNHKTDHLTVS